MAYVYWFICVREAYPSALPTAAGSQAAFNRAAVNALGNIRRSRHGIGDLLARPVANPIKDHLLCDGSAVDRVSFPQLFQEIGTEWGEGDGVNTFNLPDLVGAALPFPPDAPGQDIGGGGTVTGGTPPTAPSEPGETGGVKGGGKNTGGRPRYQYEN